MGKVDVDFAVFDDGSGSGVAVFLMNAGSGGAILSENFDIPESLAVLRIEAESAQGTVGFFICGVFRDSGGEVDFPTEVERGRPAMAGDGDFPRDVFGVAPGERQIFGGGVSVARRAAKLCPVFGGGKGG